ncbi:hypothetical protein EJ02DRAFT_437955 [Clathrospora elynae]|uniref:MARVEL domain-containing protein n=1 Tax=Clathrospora elynae TaxID=706981 RepID=A0A6A5S9F2_9PLEO|nr:hypothetical protein EJ02DRAFT_437955 [Clathrospora elynae]
MQYDRILRLALVPSILFFFLSLASVALTTHYWIIGDWIVPRGVQVLTSDYDDRLQRYKIDETIVYFTEAETDATIASGCLNLIAALMALIAWSTLRKPDMDSQFAAGKRRFWILSIVVMTIGGAATAVASMVLHYTEKGNDQYSCSPQRLMMAGKMNTNQYCTREMAACSYQPKFLKAGDRGNAAIACNEIVVVKWLQVILIINALVVLALFSVQARVRRTTREARLKEPLPEPI